MTRSPRPRSGNRTAPVPVTLAALITTALIGLLFAGPCFAQARWTRNGVEICTEGGAQIVPSSTGDGAGGAIIAWEDWRPVASSDVYAQRVLADGRVDPDWPVDGLAVCTALGNQGSPRITGDGVGGAIIAWTDWRAGNSDVYAQRVLADGTVDPSWTVDGVAVCDHPGDDQVQPALVSDGAAGAIVTWEDSRSASRDIYAQRVDSSGALDWTTVGVAVCSAAGNQALPEITTDGSGGAIITWGDNRSPNTDIYAQRVDPTGNTRWADNGVAVCDEGSDQWSPAIVASGSGGAILSWEDRRSGNWDIYSQRVDADGFSLWSAGGVMISDAPGNQTTCSIATDGSHGAILAWVDTRSGNNDVYSQRVDSAGDTAWTPAGEVVCDATDSQWTRSIVSDGSGGAIIPWDDTRSGNSDIYAQKVSDYAQTWHLAEGCTFGGFETWVLVQNPGIYPADVNLTYQTEAGPQPGPTFTLQPETRNTVNVADTVETFEVSTTVTSDRPVIAERAMYYNDRQCAHDSIGVPRPSSDWYLAEGSTAGGFETWVLVQNPGPEQANVDLVYQTDTGEVVGPSLILQPGTRETVNVAATVETWEVSTRVTASRPVVAERAMYYNDRTCAHDSIGVTEPDDTWFLAEGSTAGGFETWVLVQNPGPDPVFVDLTFETDAGQVLGPDLTLQPGTRESVDVSETVETFEVSTVVVSSGPVVAERAMYYNDRQCAHDSIGVTRPKTTWYLAEGSTFGGFETWVLVENPDTNPADIQIVYLTEFGPVDGPAFTLQPGTRESVRVSDTVDTYQVSTTVTSSIPVVAERSMYYNNRQCAHDSIGFWMY